MTNETLFGISMSKSEMQFARISLGRWMGGRGQSGSGSGQGREINLDTEERREGKEMARNPVYGDGALNR